MSTRPKFGPDIIDNCALNSCRKPIRLGETHIVDTRTDERYCDDECYKEFLKEDLDETLCAYVNLLKDADEVITARIDEEEE
jgi:hypothetical protein